MLHAHICRCGRAWECYIARCERRPCPGCGYRARATADPATQPGLEAATQPSLELDTNPAHVPAPPPVVSFEGDIYQQRSMFA